MMVLVSYDVETTTKGGQKRLRQVSKTCKNYGQRVQYSVFECVVEPAQWVLLKNQLESIIDAKKDSLRYYYLGANYRRRIEHVGAKPSYDVDDALIV
ncbi:MAG: CRISPR-associated endonuclease Cas2 [Spirochaetaceae bacterium]|jgi:CRISPR-associated protein Cas2|nr:CRISPR-associated endonuclease Cas2 [Spirochaetaceae bacterium]